MTAREVCKLLEADGWYLKAQKGSHMQFAHATKPGKVTVPWHGKRDLPKFVLANISKEAKLR